jgi:hypothetical protein
MKLMKKHAASTAPADPPDLTSPRRFGSWSLLRALPAVAPVLTSFAWVPGFQNSFPPHQDNTTKPKT